MFDTRYDANVTEDRWAVSHAVRGGSCAPEPQPMPSLGKLSDWELNQLSLGVAMSAGAVGFG